jgi:DNA-binding transcriptional ArsR family regulator
MDGSTDVFAAIAAAPRRAMLQRLADRELPVSELASTFDMTLSAVSQHLSVLRQAGLVSQRKAGKQRLYRAEPAPLKEVAEWLQTYEPFWTDRLQGLGRYLDNQATEKTS